MKIRRSLIASALSLALLAISATSWAFVSVAISVAIGPPELPVYEQPPIPAPGYIWIPGYWAWSDDGYYWVPGTWVLPPRVGFLWTPGYWSCVDSVYVWNPGYWGARVGFYGGIDYGFGYSGVGYEGGYWNRGEFYYNRAVNNINDTHITNVYNRTVVNNISVNRVSYNGGAIGVHLRPTPDELAAARGPHIGAVAPQLRQEREAMHDPQLHVTANHGRPPIAATPRPGVFTGRDVVTGYDSQGTHNVRPRSLELHPQPSSEVAIHQPGMPPRYTRAAPQASGMIRQNAAGIPPQPRPTVSSVPYPHGPLGSGYSRGFNNEPRRANFNNFDNHVTHPTFTAGPSGGSGLRAGTGYERGVHNEPVRPSYSSNLRAPPPAFRNAANEGRQPQRIPGYAPQQRMSEFRPAAQSHGVTPPVARNAYPVRPEADAARVNERHHPNGQH